MVIERALEDNPLHQNEIRFEILSKWSFVDQNQQPLNSAEHFE